MARVKILSVGQCGFDHASISQVLTKSFQAEVVAASTNAKAAVLMTKEPFDLVLVNRVGDADGMPGLDLIREMKSQPTTSAIPVMLVSNFEDAQAEAQQLGALAGFGKSDLSLGKELGPLKSLFVK